MAGKITVSTLNNDTGVLATQNGMTAIPKAYGRFTYNGSTITNINSFNISSITYVSTGLFLITMTTAQSNANYSIVGASGDPTNASTGCWFTYGYSVNSGGFSPTTTQFRIQIYYATGNNPGNSDVSFAILGS